jgi:flagellar biogenesis protein FliO
MEVDRETGAVIAVLSLLLLTLWWLRRRGLDGAALVRKPADRRLECLERLPLGPQQTLHLVKLGSATLLIASSPAGCAVLHHVPGREIEHHGDAAQ